MEFLPKLGSDKFKCPHCQVVSQQRWFDVSSASEAANAISNEVFYSYRARIQHFQQDVITEFLKSLQVANDRHMQDFVPRNFSVATCASCGGFTLWAENDLVYPKHVSVDPPNEDMNEDIRSLYFEAATIVTDSPRGAAALLRLALQILLKQLGKSGKNINTDIKELVSEGLSPKIQQALDLLRVVGNNAVHPGKIDIDDSPDVALKLFHVINFIANEMITKPKELELLYTDLVPDDTKQHIQERDRKDAPE
ncbi:DUF4145 domain-containing protein [Marinobacter sp.]|uniref:DUF4145 domain-containing protein n=1 Tax=Marinobacter sp. TaxID=50741 RepID=UPI0035C73566